MERYVDSNARGGILEPPGICDVKFRKPDLLKTMHRLDSKLTELDAELAAAEEALVADEEACSHLPRHCIPSRHCTPALVTEVNTDPLMIFP